MTERDAWIAFSSFPQIGPARFKLLVQFFGSAKAAWNAPKKKLLEIGFSEKLANSFDQFRLRYDLIQYKNALKKLSIEVVISEDKNFPQRLKDIDDSPSLLYVRKGEKECALSDLAQISVAVVGTRKMTSYGREMTKKFVERLVDGGVTIISGLALGVDAIAHQTALELGGKTIAVLGGGLDNIYPPRNTNLAEQIVKNNSGALVSEYPLNYPAMPQNFPFRNRIVSGLSLGVLVIEGSEKSGTLLTASNAASQGREVFAVPGPLTSGTSWAPHFLIKNGAKLVQNPEDILDELDIKSKIKSQKSKVILPETVQEQKIMEVLGAEGADIDSLVRISGLATGILLATLTGMELKGMVKNIGGIYVLVT